MDEVCLQRTNTQLLAKLFAAARQFAAATVNSRSTVSNSSKHEVARLEDGARVTSMHITI